MSAVTTPGPETVWSACQTLTQVAPPSIETSTSAVDDTPVLMKSLAHRMPAFETDERSIGGVTRYASSKLNPGQLLLRMAKAPEPPVRFPSNCSQGSAPERTSQPRPPGVSSVQPAGIVPASKDSERTFGPNVPGA